MSREDEIITFLKEQMLVSISELQEAQLRVLFSRPREKFHIVLPRGRGGKSVQLKAYQMICDEYIRLNAK